MYWHRIHPLHNSWYTLHSRHHFHVPICFAFNMNWKWVNTLIRICVYMRLQIIAFFRLANDSFLFKLVNMFGFYWNSIFFRLFSFLSKGQKWTVWGNERSLMYLTIEFNARNSIKWYRWKCCIYKLGKSWWQCHEYVHCYWLTDRPHAFYISSMKYDDIEK